MRLLIALSLAITACGPGVAQRGAIEPANHVRQWCFSAESKFKGERVTGQGCFSSPALCQHAHGLASGWVGRQAKIKAVTRCEEEVR